MIVEKKKKPAMAAAGGIIGFIFFPPQEVERSNLSEIARVRRG